MQWYKRIQEIDRRLIYAILFLAVTLPLMFPIGLPILINETSRAAFNTIDKLPSGAKVIYSFDYDGASTAEMSPMALAMVKYSFQKGHKVYLYGLWAEGPTIASILIDPMAKDLNKQYGIDYVNFGYRPSYAAVLESARKDLIKALNNTDVKGEKLDSYPIMKGLTKASDVDCVVSFTTGGAGMSEWIFYWYSTGDVKTITGGVTGVNTPTYMPIYQARQVQGFLGGLRGAAEMEIMTNNHGNAIPGMDAQSIAHLVIIAFLILGNIGYLATRNAQGKKK